jgi:hypothetical protein
VKKIRLFTKAAHAALVYTQYGGSITLDSLEPPSILAHSTGIEGNDFLVIDVKYREFFKEQNR